MNAFRLWGSYVGFLLGAVAGYFSFAAVLALCEFGPCRPTVVLIPFIPPVLGFLVGWGVHVLVKKLISGS